MPLEEIVTALSMRLVMIGGSPCQVIFAVTMQDVIAEIARTLGDKALTMNAADLMTVQKEVRIAINHDLDLRDYIQPGIEVWQVQKSMN